MNRSCGPPPRSTPDNVDCIIGTRGEELSVSDNFRPVEPALKALLESLSPNDTDYSVAIERAERYARSFVNDAKFGALAYRIGGSIGKGTAISPLSDVDLYLYLAYDTWRTTRGEPLLPSTVIGRLRKRVEQRLGSPLSNGYVTVRPQGHSVGIRFKKAGSVGIDVVPAIFDDDNIENVVIPRRGTDRFIPTSIERQLALLDHLDSPFKYLRHGIRLLKYWNRQREIGLHSYAVEVICMFAVTKDCKRTAMGVFLSALEFIESTKMREPVYIDHFFRFEPPARRACVILDPAIPDNNLGAHLDARDGDRLGSAARHTLAKLRRAADAADRGHGLRTAELLSEAFGRPDLFAVGA